MIPEKVIFGTDMDGNISSIQQVLQTIWPNLSICPTYPPFVYLSHFINTPQNKLEQIDTQYE